VEQESGWNTWATRYEPNYRWLYPNRHEIFDPPLASRATEVHQQKTSWGLMQIMGATARARGFTGDFCSQLCDPATGLEYGCRHLRRLIDRFGSQYDHRAVLSAYNTGHPQRVNEVYIESLMRHYVALQPIVAAVAARLSGRTGEGAGGDDSAS
jgi:hypothetical protein